MTEPTKNILKIEILGETYTLKTTEDEKYVKSLVDYLNKKMNGIKAETNNILTDKKIAILTALYITDELFQLMDQTERVGNDASEKINSLIKLLDEGIIEITEKSPDITQS